MLIGMLIVKHQFQPNGIKAAPSNGPPIAEIPNTLPRIPNALPRPSKGNSSAMNAPAIGNRAPQPKPCMILPKNINSILMDAAIKKDPNPHYI